MTIRGDILRHGIELTEGDRNKAYGDPYDNLTCFADLVDSYLKGLGWESNDSLDAVDGSVIMNLAKISRIAANKDHEDNYVDAATYMAIAGECANHTEINRVYSKAASRICDVINAQIATERKEAAQSTSDEIKEFLDNNPQAWVATGAEPLQTHPQSVKQKAIVVDDNAYQQDRNNGIIRTPYQLKRCNQCGTDYHFTPNEHVFEKICPDCEKTAINKYLDLPC